MVAAEPLDRDDPARQRSTAAAAATASPSPVLAWLPAGADQLQAPGPQSGQAFGWAWKRRSRGSSYSARQRAHISKPAIVVSGRSYGTPRDDREARSAVRAVDERVAVAAVGRIEELGEAVRAGRGVGRDQRLRLAPLALTRRSRSRARLAGRRLARVDRLDHGERRRLRVQAARGSTRRRGVALDLEQHAALVVAHPAAEPELLREPET